MHEALAMAFAGVLGQHLAERGPFAGLPHLHHAAVQLLEKRRPELERELRGQAVLRKAVAQGAAGQECDGAVVVVLHGAAHRPAQASAVVQVMRHAQRRDRHHLEVPVGVHVAQGHQGAVLRLQRGGIVRQRVHAQGVAALCQQPAERRIALAFEGHVGDEVRQLVAGVGALEVRRAVDVVARVHQPVGVEHHQRVHAGFAAAAGDLVVPVNGVLPRALARPWQLAEVHAGHMGDFGGECDGAHANSCGGGVVRRSGALVVKRAGSPAHAPQCGMWCPPSDTATFLGSRKTS